MKPMATSPREGDKIRLWSWGSQPLGPLPTWGWPGATAWERKGWRCRGGNAGERQGRVRSWRNVFLSCGCSEARGRLQYRHCPSAWSCALPCSSPVSKWWSQALGFIE